MAPVVVPGFEFKDIGPDGGKWTETDDPKLELHTTEGGSVAGAESAMKKYPSHFCVSYEEKLRRQYVSLDKSAYANKNNDTARLYQVEIVGKAAETRNWSDDKLKWLGEEVFRPIMDATGVPPVIIHKGFHDGTEGIKPYISTASSPLRISTAELFSFSGILGHQHMPSPDSHWDPGALNVAKILKYAYPDEAAKEDEKMLSDIIEMFELYLGVTRAEIMASKDLRQQVAMHEWRCRENINGMTITQLRRDFDVLARHNGRL